MTYDDLLKEIYSHHFRGLKPGLERIKFLLKELGDPHLNYDYVHVAGTNGKGSTAHYCSEILKRDGKKVGLFTSPHLNDFRERVRVDGEMAKKEKIEPMLEELLKITKTNYSSFFEITTALAMEYFKEERVDVAVLEVGMGGRWDATNMVDSKISIITDISLEHTGYLGNTVEKIAYEKAGIIKNGSKVTTGTQGKALAAIKNVTAQRNASLKAINIDFQYEIKRMEIEGSEFDYINDGKKIELENRLAGLKQIEDACLAVNALEEKVKEESIKKGVKEAYAAGRFEVINSENNQKIILDGAHNPGASLCLAENLKKFGIKPIFVLGILKDKDYPGIVRNLCPLSDLTIVAEPRSERKLDKRVLAEAAKKYTSVIASKNLKAGIEIAKSFKRDVCITGSFYLVGEAREILGLTKRERIFLGDF
jgi:dihydrofolate synthase/folylpolyglutamate synthase